MGSERLTSRDVISTYGTMTDPYYGFNPRHGFPQHQSPGQRFNMAGKYDDAWWKLEN